MKEELVVENDKKQEKLDLQYKGTRLCLDNKPIQQFKQIKTPQPMDILDMSADDLDYVLKLKVNKGDEITERGSRFIGYSLSVKNSSQVQSAYMKVKLLHPSANHVMCAYILPNQDQCLFNKDYCDDGEHGGGRAILNYMEQLQIQNKVFMVVRYYGGQKLQAARFDRIRDAVYNVAAAEIPSLPQSTTGENAPNALISMPAPNYAQIISKYLPNTQQAIRGTRPQRPASKSYQRGAYSARGKRVNSYSYRGNSRGRTYNHYRGLPRNSRGNQSNKKVDSSSRKRNNLTPSPDSMVRRNQKRRVAKEYESEGEEEMEVASQESQRLNEDWSDDRDGRFDQDAQD